MRQAASLGEDEAAPSSAPPLRLHRGQPPAGRPASPCWHLAGRLSSFRLQGLTAGRLGWGTSFAWLDSRPAGFARYPITRAIRHPHRSRSCIARLRVMTTASAGGGARPHRRHRPRPPPPRTSSPAPHMPLLPACAAPPRRHRIPAVSTTPVAPHAPQHPRPPRSRPAPTT